MNFVITIMLVMVAAVALALGAIEEPGYVLIGYGEWRMETTLSLLLLALIAGFVITYYTIRLGLRVVRIPRRTKEWNQRRNTNKARNGLNNGLLLLASGDWRGAEKHLLKKIDYSDNPMVNYLAAARAAQKQGAEDRRDRYLLAAHKNGPKQEVAIGLTQAELQISHHQPEQALATLTRLRSVAPRNRYVLEMLMRLYVSMGDWNRLSELLPELRKRKVITGPEADTLERNVHTELLNAAAISGELMELQQEWERLPRRLTKDKTLQITYVGHLQILGAGDEAETLVRKSLKKGWNKDLVTAYGELEGADSAKQLAVAEKWLNGHEKDPDLLFSLGQLSMRNQIWGKARGYLESSIGISPTVEAYQLLATLLEQLGEPVEAAECYRKATMLASDNAVLPPPVEEKETIEVVEALEDDGEEEEKDKPSLSAPASS